jgi:tRNA(Arg) A34 adenosine deaminase TadA
MIAASYKPKKKFMQLAIAEAKRARDRGDYAIGAVVTRVTDGREVVIASAGNRVKTSGSSIKHVELETLKYVSSGYGRYLTEFVLYTTHEPCAMCAGACVWARIGALYTESRRKTSPLMAERAGRKNTSGEPASSPADWSSRRAITLYLSSVVFYVTNVRNYSVTVALNRTGANGLRFRMASKMTPELSPRNGSAPVAIS